MRRVLAVMAAAAALALLAVTGFAQAAPAASAHRSGCHTRHECPSDHATYKWRGMWCVSPTAEERTAKFKIRVRYGGRTYFCHKGRRP